MAREEAAQERADAVDRDRHAGVGRRFGQSDLQIGRRGLRVGHRSDRSIVPSAFRQNLQRRVGRGGRQRIAAQSARLVDVAQRGQQVHDLGPSAADGQGQPPADDLAQAGQVGPDAVALLGAAEGHAKAR